MTISSGLQFFRMKVSSHSIMIGPELFRNDLWASWWRTGYRSRAPQVLYGTYPLHPLVDWKISREWRQLSPGKYYWKLSNTVDRFGGKLGIKGATFRIMSPEQDWLEGFLTDWSSNYWWLKVFGIRACNPKTTQFIHMNDIKNHFFSLMIPNNLYKKIITEPQQPVSNILFMIVSLSMACHKFGIYEISSYIKTLGNKKKRKWVWMSILKIDR